MERLDDVTIEVEEGQFVLVLHGDMLDTCERYLEDEEATSMTFLYDPELLEQALIRARRLRQ
jgi:hypothetical protein